jgi:hypothetical protein
MSTYKPPFGLPLKIFNPQNEGEEIKHQRKDDTKLTRLNYFKIKFNNFSNIFELFFLLKAKSCKTYLYLFNYDIYKEYYLLFQTNYLQ